MAPSGHSYAGMDEAKALATATACTESVSSLGGLKYKYNMQNE